VLVVMPLVPCVLAIEAGYKGGVSHQCAAKWNTTLLVVYMVFSYGSMGLMMMRSGGAGLWTCYSLAVCYALLALIAAMWLRFHRKMTALTAEGGSVLDKLDSGSSERSWQVRLQQATSAALGGPKELDLSSTSVGAHAGDVERLGSVLGECNNLETLKLTHCIELRTLPRQLSECGTLVMLDLGGCGGLESLPDLSSRLELKVENVPTHLSEWEKRGFKSYNFMYDDRVYAANPTELDFSGFKGTELPSGLRRCKELVTLKLSGCSRLARLSYPSRGSDLGCQELVTLDLTNCSMLTSLPELNMCNKLTELTLTGCTKLKILPNLPRARKGPHGGPDDGRCIAFTAAQMKAGRGAGRTFLNVSTTKASREVQEWEESGYYFDHTGKRRNGTW
jgi:hypothetical protein